MLRATQLASDASTVPFDIVVLTRDERHLRRKVLTLQHGDQLLVDLANPTVLDHGERLLLDDGRQVEVIAADEALLEARAFDGEQLAMLAWHIGNRHLAAQIELDRILIARDHVIRDMLVGLGAKVQDVHEPFHPLRGAYDNGGKAAGGHHGHHHHDAHDHSHRQGHDHSHDRPHRAQAPRVWRPD